MSSWVVGVVTIADLYKEENVTQGIFAANYTKGFTYSSIYHGHSGVTSVIIVLTTAIRVVMILVTLAICSAMGDNVG